jgi:hypothetical protein
MKALVEAARKVPALELVGQESVEEVTLADGTEALLLTAEFVKEQRRRSLQMKLLARDKDAASYVLSGFLVGGKESQVPTPTSGLARWLRAHLTSFTLDGKKLAGGPGCRLPPRRQAVGIGLRRPDRATLGSDDRQNRPQAQRNGRL